VEEILQEGHRFEQRRVLDQAGKIQVAKQMPQVEFELEVESAVVGPFKAGPVELNFLHVVRDLSKAFRITESRIIE
jgi:hypothetical protein